LFQQASIGSCIVTTYTGNSTVSVVGVTPTYLDAGATITMTGGTSPQTLTRNQIGSYSIPTPSGSAPPPTFIPSGGGTFTFTNGSGGADVGALQNAAITIGAPITWTNMAQVTNVTRANGQLITWSGGNAGTYVQMTGSSFYLDAASNLSEVVLFSCSAPVSAGQFTIPAAVLLQLPPSSSTSVGGVSIPTGSLAVGNYANPVKFTASGLDVGYVSAYVTNSNSVNYQ
jgi:hypothetical protein